MKSLVFSPSTICLQRLSYSQVRSDDFDNQVLELQRGTKKRQVLQYQHIICNISQQIQWCLLFQVPETLRSVFWHNIRFPSRFVSPPAPCSPYLACRQSYMHPVRFFLFPIQGIGVGFQDVSCFVSFLWIRNLQHMAPFQNSTWMNMLICSISTTTAILRKTWPNQFRIG